MTAHALDVLEFDAVVEKVAARATSDVGREAVRARTPATDADVIRAELGRVDAMLSLLEAAGGPVLPEIPDAGAALRRLGTEGSVLDPLEAGTVGDVLAGARLLAEVVRPHGEDLPPLARLARGLHPDPDAEGEIGAIVSDDGEVRDGASPELRRLRREIRDLRSSIVERLESYIGTLPERYVVPDASVSIRQGRYVIPIRREGRSHVGGVVHDESASGTTLFVEPPLALELMNELHDLERAERREVERILAALTDRLRPDHPALEESHRTLVAFDSLYARARYAREVGAGTPELVEAGEALEIVGGRHPLLEAGDEEVVPFDLRLDPGERAVVVSGPNTGGKSVFLKAMGLIAALTQAGFIPPVRIGTRLPVFTEIYADIGDEQSIARSLSTFSAHLENLKRILEGAGPTSLVLVDEIGSGTDPAEGAALARSVLSELVDRGALTLVSSHLGALKRLAGEAGGFVNASLRFDPEGMEPTYELVKGRPGRSYGLAIARRLGFPEEVLDRAEESRPRGEAEVEELLAELEREEKEASELTAELRDERERLEARAREVEERAREVEEREKSAERRAKEEARELLMDAREEVESAIREIREAAAEGAAPEVEEASHRARRRVEEAARRHRETKPEAPSPGEGRREAPDVAEGDRVKVESSGATGTVVELRDDRAVIDASGIKLDVPVTALSAAEAAAGAEAGPGGDGGGGWTGPAVDASPEVDLRGLRVHEVEGALVPALDRAILSNLSTFRIIHGKGTGAVRERVRELLDADPRIDAYRDGRPGEGGTGVTVVEP